MKKKIRNIKGIYEISGFGKNTTYEKGCQNMLQAGYEWLEKRKKKAKLKGHTFKGVYGIFELDSPDAKELSKVTVDTEPECTGAMHQAVMQHLFYINGHGIDKWEKEVKK